MTRYAKRKLKYSLNENFNLLPYVEWDRFVTLTGAQAESGLRYRIYTSSIHCTTQNNSWICRYRLNGKVFLIFSVSPLIHVKLKKKYSRVS